MTTSAALAAMLVVLGLFAVVGVTTRFRPTADDYLAARSSQRAGPLALSLYASGMGVWILFTPPIVAAFTGILGVVAYAVAAAAPLVALGVLGPRVRRSLPTGITLTDWIGTRHGRPFQAYVAVVAVFYMFMFLTAELTAIGQVLALPAFGAAEPWSAIVATAAVTAAYTAHGGLPASLRTDRWQGWLVLLLFAVGLVAIVVDVDSPGRAAMDGGLTVLHRAGFEAIGVLVIAVTAANLLHQGYWQRMWAATDAAALRASTTVAAALTLATVSAVGLTGLIAAGTGEPVVPFFDLLAGLPGPVRLLIVVLAVALVASSVDTLQNAMAAVVARDVARGRVGIGPARLVTLALVVPAGFIAVRGYDILRLFLIADLVAAATVGPVFLGLGRRVSGTGAIIGSITGLVAVFAVGAASGGGPAGGWASLTIADSPTLELSGFATALVASTVVSSVWPADRAGTAGSTVPGHEPGRRPVIERGSRDGPGDVELAR